MSTGLIKQRQFQEHLNFVISRAALKILWSSFLRKNTNAVTKKVLRNETILTLKEPNIHKAGVHRSAKREKWGNTANSHATVQEPQTHARISFCGFLPIMLATWNVKNQDCSEELPNEHLQYPARSAHTTYSGPQGQTTQITKICNGNSYCH